MNVVEKKISELVPYAKNPRNNGEAVKYVANSIKEFGFKVPIVIDSHGVIVAGHTRFMASKQLGLESVPCIVADDLTDAQIKAFRLADNKVSEKAEWDYSLLNEEIEALIDFNMEDFGFEFIEDQEDVDSKNERTRTDEAYHLGHIDVSRTEGFYQMPIIEAEKHVPTKVLGFNYALTSEEFDAGIHFYIDDYQFERIWNDPNKYIEKLMAFDCAFSPDFSLYMDMPMAMKIWNVFRSRLIGQMMQDAGITVIPTISWAEPETFAFAFDGIRENATVSISTVGVKRDKESMKVWKAGVDALIARKHPATIIVYGGEVEYDYGNIKVVYLENAVTERMKNNGR